MDQQSPQSPRIDIRDRIRELRRVPARQLQPHPRNWRRHPAAQRAALAGLLTEIGYADALLARERPDGALELIDGHLRAATTPDATVPVLLLDLNDAEADLLLATLDPIGALADCHTTLLADLVGQLHVEQPEVERLLTDLTRTAPQPDSPPTDKHAAALPTLGGLYQLVVDCADEPQQRALYERLTTEGYTCRVVVMAAA